MKLLIIILSFTLLSCSNLSPRLENENAMVLHVQDTGTYSGKLIGYYPENDQKKYEELYAKGIKNGQYVCWHKNGKIKLSGTYAQNKRVGVWKWYNEKGDVKYAVNYSKK
jgi:antitoxin component YwqK of YwqJK toxin-antitoxin module